MFYQKKPPRTDWSDLLSPELAEEFWKLVDKGKTTANPECGDCWVWNGPEDFYGAGFFLVGRQLHKAHRVAWSLVNGEDIGQARYLKRTCGNTHCVRPLHCACHASATGKEGRRE